nr:DUF924 family protein [Parvularcula dongshanensis]
MPTLPGEAEEVLRFWFDELPPEKHFAQDDEIDAAIRQRFADLHAEASKSGLDWAGSPRGALAVLLLLDQFSRNLFRESPRAFENDAAALDLARRLVADGFDLALPRAERAFVYLPFMHSERMEDQNACVALYRDRLPGSMNLPFALEHREEIHRYGRFRGRDAALGR